MLNKTNLPLYAVVLTFVALSISATAQINLINKDSLKELANIIVAKNDSTRTQNYFERTDFFHIYEKTFKESNVFVVLAINEYEIMGLRIFDKKNMFIWTYDRVRPLEFLGDGKMISYNPTAGFNDAVNKLIKEGLTAKEYKQRTKGQERWRKDTAETKKIFLDLIVEGVKKNPTKQEYGASILEIENLVIRWSDDEDFASIHSPDHKFMEVNFKKEDGAWIILGGEFENLSKEQKKILKRGKKELGKIENK